MDIKAGSFLTCEKSAKRLCWCILNYSLVFEVLYLERQEKNVRDSWISQMQQQMALVLNGQLLLSFRL